MKPQQQQLKQKPTASATDTFMTGVPRHGAESASAAAAVPPHLLPPLVSSGLDSGAQKKRSAIISTASTVVMLLNRVTGDGDDNDAKEEEEEDSLNDNDDNPTVSRFTRRRNLMKRKSKNNKNTSRSSLLPPIFPKKRQSTAAAAGENKNNEDPSLLLEETARRLMFDAETRHNQFLNAPMPKQNITLLTAAEQQQKQKQKPLMTIKQLQELQRKRADDKARRALGEVGRKLAELRDDADGFARFTASVEILKRQSKRRGSAEDDIIERNRSALDERFLPQNKSALHKQRFEEAERHLEQVKLRKQSASPTGRKATTTRLINKKSSSSLGAVLCPQPGAVVVSWSHVVILLTAARSVKNIVAAHHDRMAHASRLNRVRKYARRWQLRARVQAQLKSSILPFPHRRDALSTFITYSLARVRVRIRARAAAAIAAVLSQYQDSMRVSICIHRLIGAVRNMQRLFHAKKATRGQVCRLFTLQFDLELKRRVADARKTFNNSTGGVSASERRACLDYLNLGKDINEIRDRMISDAVVARSRDNGIRFAAYMVRLKSWESKIRALAGLAAVKKANNNNNNDDDVNDLFVVSLPQ
eukprot:PhM_4_TR5203/c2_g1_i1/m.50839